MLRNKNQKAINIRLNSETNNSSNRMIKVKAEESKAFKKEIKLWKKKLGKERRKSIKLERTLAQVSEEQAMVTSIGSPAFPTIAMSMMKEEALCTI